MSDRKLDPIRRAIAAVQAAGFRVHHVEIGSLLWQRAREELLQCESRDDVGYGSRPGGAAAPLIDGVVAVPGLIPSIDEWALVFRNANDAATDYALTPEHRALYERAMADGKLPDLRKRGEKPK